MGLTKLRAGYGWEIIGFSLAPVSIAWSVAVLPFRGTATGFLEALVPRWSVWQWVSLSLVLACFLFQALVWRFRLRATYVLLHLVLLLLSLGAATNFAGGQLFSILGVAAFSGPALSALVSTAGICRDRTIAWVLFVSCFGLACLFSMHRHAAFGSGAWDMGCMVHNFYRSSHFLDSTSTVLGTVDYLGDHFMPGIYLFAPFFWLNSSAYMVLFVQSASLAITAPAIFWIARNEGASSFLAGALGLSVGLSYGLQSAAYFDAHGITVGFGFFAAALMFLERGQYRRATLMLGIFFLFKESVGAYIVALGAMLAMRGVRRRETRALKYGMVWLVMGALGFVVVNRLLMPWLRKGANAPEPHETYRDFGPTVFAAAVGVLTHPLKAITALFFPSAKLASWTATISGVGGLCFFSAEVLVASLPLIAERFLSSKPAMWEMGYHYAAPLCLYAGWAAAKGLPRFIQVLQRYFPGKADEVLLGYVLSSWLLSLSFGYKTPSNFLAWNHDYFALGQKGERYRRAVKILRREPRETRLAVQNRLLPHLADRPWIYQLHDYQEAEQVLLAKGDSAWPKDSQYAARLSRKLLVSGEWERTHQDQNVEIYTRRKSR